jgi:hypothetical protein
MRDVTTDIDALLGGGFGLVATHADLANGAL